MSKYIAIFSGKFICGGNISAHTCENYCPPHISVKNIINLCLIYNNKIDRFSEFFPNIIHIWIQIYEYKCNKYKFIIETKLYAHFMSK